MDILHAPISLPQLILRLPNALSIRCATQEKFSGGPDRPFDNGHDRILLSGSPRQLRAKQELEGKLSDLRRTLMAGLTEQFDREMRRGTERIEDTVAPFARFVRAENDKITAQKEQSIELEAHIVGLQAQLKAGEATA